VSASASRKVAAGALTVTFLFVFAVVTSFLLQACKERDAKATQMPAHAAHWDAWVDGHITYGYDARAHVCIMRYHEYDFALDAASAMGSASPVECTPYVMRHLVNPPQ
jgi:hypothetical protein